MSLIEARYVWGVYSPYETFREPDPSETPLVTFRKELPGGDTDLTLTLTGKGSLSNVDASITKGNLTINYYFCLAEGLSITADSELSDFGPIEYDKGGRVSSINITSLQNKKRYLENLGISDAEAMWYLLSLIELFSGNKEIPQELKKRIDAFPKLQLSDEEKESLMKEITGGAQRFRHFADNVQDFVTVQSLDRKYHKSIVLKDGGWVVIERDENGKDSVVMPIAWNQNFFLDEQRFALIEKDGSFIFYQESANRKRKKAIMAPSSVDYDELDWYMGDVVRWDKVFKVYPSYFYERV